MIPVYNSESSIRELVSRLEVVLHELTNSWEIILVDDGSRDGSWGVVREITSFGGKVRGLRLIRNFGQHNALLAGIRACRFSVTVTMDDDLQHPPEEIPKLVRRLDRGNDADVVYGTPAEMQHSFWRNAFSRFTKATMARAMRVDSIVDINAFRAFRTPLRDAFQSFSSPQLLLDVLLAWGTSRFTAIKVDHKPRASGRSNYTPIKLFNQAMLMLTGFSTAPLRFASSLGFFFTFFGLAVLVYVLVRYVATGSSVAGFPFLASVIAIFAGAQLFALGIIGEYLARMFHRSMERPVYFVKESAGWTSATGVDREPGSSDRT